MNSKNLKAMKSVICLILLLLFSLMHQNLSNAQQPESDNQGQITVTKVENRNIPGGDYKNLVLMPGKPVRNVWKSV